MGDGKDTAMSRTLIAIVLAACGFSLASVSSVSAGVPGAHIQVTKGVANAPSSGICDATLTYGPTAEGVGCTNFCYKIQVSNDGQEDLTGVTINDPDIPGLTVPSPLAMGQMVTIFASKIWCAAGGHVNTVMVSGVGTTSGTPVSAFASATVVIFAPTPTATPTPTVTPTSTSTPTETPTPTQTPTETPTVTPTPTVCGNPGEQCCPGNTCNVANLICQSETGTCVQCGTPTDPCCAGDTCFIPDTFVCQSGTCQLCGRGSPCCAGDTCFSPNLVCQSGTCQLCLAGSPCCAGDTCDAPDLVCQSGTCLLVTPTPTLTPTSTATPTVTPTSTQTPTPLALGQACTSGTQCASTFCALGGVCCNVPCNEPNQSCTLPGSVGLCRVLGGVAPAASHVGLMALSLGLAVLGIATLRRAFTARR